MRWVGDLGNFLFVLNLGWLSVSRRWAGLAIWGKKNSRIFFSCPEDGLGWLSGEKKIRGSSISAMTIMKNSHDYYEKDHFLETQALIY
jgi:hypothetical protein